MATAGRPGQGARTGAAKGGLGQPRGAGVARGWPGGGQRQSGVARAAKGEPYIVMARLRWRQRQENRQLGSR